MTNYQGAAKLDMTNDKLLRVAKVEMTNDKLFRVAKLEMTNDKLLRDGKNWNDKGKFLTRMAILMMTMTVEGRQIWQ